MSYNFNNVVFNGDQKRRDNVRYAFYSIVGIPFVVLFIVFKHVQWALGFSPTLTNDKLQAESSINAAPAVTSQEEIRFHVLEKDTGFDGIVEELLDKYYRVIMPSEDEYKIYKGQKIYRTTHGVLHATRVMLLANSLNEGLKEHLRDPLNKLAQVAGIQDPRFLLLGPLLHDSGREGGAADEWDHISGENVTMTLLDKGVNETWAYLIGLYTGHKDHPEHAQSYVLSDTVDSDTNRNKLAYRHSKGYEALEDRVKTEAKTIVEEHHRLLSYVGLLSSLGDCADIQRCKPVFYKNYYESGVEKLLEHVAGTGEGPAAEAIRSVCMSHIGFAASLITATGDNFDRKNFPLKANLERSTVSQVREIAKQQFGQGNIVAQQGGGFAP